MVKIIELGTKNSIINNFIAELRDVNIQNDRMRFRRNLERIGEAMALEISKSLEYKDVTITTPLGEKKMSLIAEQPVIGTIMRAGLPLHQGFLNVFDKADNVFISQQLLNPSIQREIDQGHIRCPNKHKDGDHILHVGGMPKANATILRGVATC